MSLANAFGRNLLMVRKRTLWQYRFNLHKLTAPAFALNSDGSAGFGAQDVTWPLVPTYKNVLCYYKATDNYSNPVAAGRYKEENIFTTDIFYFAGTQELGEGWLLQNADLKSLNYNQVWVTKGAARIDETLEAGTYSRLKIEAIEVIAPPGFARPKPHTT